MRNHVLGIFLCVMLMVGTLAGTASADFTFPDVADDADYAWAAELTQELGIFTGDNNGNFNPDQGITRAQCAAVVCRLLDAESDAQSMTTAAFTDVPASHWANGYIAWSYDQGIINGYGNGKFGPSDTVTYEQAIKMLMGGIGYGDAAIDAGGYPYGYLSVAEGCGFLNGVENTFGNVITRANIAVLVANIVQPQAPEEEDLWIYQDIEDFAPVPDELVSESISGLSSALPEPSLSSDDPSRMAHNIYVDPDLSGTSQRFDGFLIDFRAEEAGTGTYWALCNWQMDTSCLSSGCVTNEGGAYAGLQMRTDGPKSILSFWDISWIDANACEQTITAQLIYPGSSESGRFDGEGEGANYITDYPWEADTWYRMYLGCYEDAASGHTLVEQWIRALPDGQWKQICCFDTGLSDSCFVGSMSQFMENYQSEYAAELRSFEYRNIYVRDVRSSQWTPITAAEISIDTWWNNKKGTFVFGADETTLWGVTQGYGADTAELNEDISARYSVCVFDEPDIPPLAEQIKTEPVYRKPTVTISGEVSPSGTLTQGSNFGIRGNVQTDAGKITKIYGAIVDVYGSTVQDTTCYPNAASDNLRYSINKYLIFENLAAGNYQYIVGVWTESDGVEDYTLLVSSDFEIGGSAVTTGDTYVYSGTTFGVVPNFKTEYCFNQNDYSRFVNSAGKNRGCTATAMCIAYSIYHDSSLSPNNVKWSSGGTSWEYCTRYADSSQIYKGNTFTQTGALKAAYDCILSSRKPMIVGVNGYSSDHVVTIVGVAQNADRSSLSLGDFLIVDPYGGAIRTLAYFNSVDCEWALRIPT